MESESPQRSCGQIFCTVLDSRYIAKAIALVRSLQRHDPNFQMFALCLDQETERTVDGSGSPCIKTVRLDHLTPCGRIEEARRNRSHRHFAWTMASVLCNNLLKWAVGPDLWYLDADCFFFGCHDSVMGEIVESRASIAVTPHRFPLQYAHYVDRGCFCQSATWFRNDPIGRECASHWAGQCLDRCDDSTVGDQKYLDEWPARHGDKLHVIGDVGWGVGPWHAAAYRWPGDGLVRAHRENSAVPLVMYHFHELRLAIPGDWLNIAYRDFAGSWCWTPRTDGAARTIIDGPTWRLTDYPLTADAVQHVYRPYLDELESAEKGIAECVSII